MCARSNESLIPKCFALKSLASKGLASKGLASKSLALKSLAGSRSEMDRGLRHENASNVKTSAYD
jgi:hypothetical protein